MKRLKLERIADSAVRAAIDAKDALKLFDPITKRLCLCFHAAIPLLAVC
jgi:hypothetical protein